MGSLKGFVVAWLLGLLGMCLCGPAAFGRERISFEERVKAQEAIERVYYQKRIWPKENPGPKPPFEKMVPRAQIEAKVTDYLRKSDALDQFWQRPIEAHQLQAEMDRMAKGTKDPETLKELFAALGNDPYLIAECLARPVLAERLIRNWYAFDGRVHGELKARAEAEVSACGWSGAMKGFSDEYSEVLFAKAAEGAIDIPAPDSDREKVKLEPEEWERLLGRLGVAPTSERGEEAAPVIVPGKLLGLREVEDAFSVEAVLSFQPDQIRIARVAWRKTPFDAWWKEQQEGGSLRLGEEAESSTTSLILP